ncbi:hypothetical protein GCM10023189_13590 [Nibrella saemangeumensis]|uniref:Uncharacterized protein n=1 Tax=Nibrella saemangeumensis TaxID=1084526 RepID=A0ABP8MMN9_9BACT
MSFNPTVNYLKSRTYKGAKPDIAEKFPYLVKGQGNTIKYLTAKQAADRDDIIPQFNQQQVTPK